LARLRPILADGAGLLARESDACPYLAAADVLITDHSSVGFEYLLLDRPVVRIEMPELLSKTDVNSEYVRLLAEASTSVHDVRGTLDAVERGFAEPTLKSNARRSVAEELFYKPGTATQRAVRELYEVLELEPPIEPRIDRPDRVISTGSNGNHKIKASETIRCVQHLFEAQVRRAPHAVALSFENTDVTYRELNSRANKVAHYLKRFGVGPEILVGISLERSPDMIVALLATLKAGGAYVPLDPAYPAERLSFMVEDSNTSVLLTEHRLIESLPKFSGRVICLDAEWDLISEEPDGNPIVAIEPKNLAYVIYTSGSTGTPKGVAIEHRSLLNYVETAISQYEITPEDRVLQFASINFDTSAEEIYPCLGRGSTLVLRTESMFGSVSHFMEGCRAGKISILDLPTAYWHELVVALSTEELRLPESIRLVIIGGEKALPNRLERWKSVIGDSVRLVNTYGPTEATIVTTMYDLTHAAVVTEQVPIGLPIPNAETYILDSQYQPVPIGVTGELYIGGIGLARGYLNRPELTAQRFTNNPFSSKPGARLYKTGDLARYTSDKTIEYVGRADDQVKVNGFRIELGEIESLLRLHPGIGDCVVAAQEDSDFSKHLVAYIVPEERGQNAVEPHDLREFLSKKLPAHMLPAAFVVMDALPLSVNGKIDKDALPRPTNIRSVTAKRYVRPRDPLEYELVHIWEELLKLQPIGIRDDFFEIGGNSLLAVRMLGQIERVFGKILPLSTLFSGTTIEHLARTILEKSDQSVRSRLVRVQAGGTRKPLFFLPGDFNGGGLYCLNLCRHLGKDQPFFALQPHGLDDQPVPTTIEQMAADQVKTLRAFKPDGPYLLGGFCNGALVAFEMARQLSAVGERVELLVLILASASNARFKWLDYFNRLIPSFNSQRSAGRFDRFLRIRERVLTFQKSGSFRLDRLQELERSSQDEQMSFVHRTIVDCAARLKAAISNGTERSNGLSKNSTTVKPSEERREKLLSLYGRAIAAYIPGSYSGRITLLWPEEEPSETPGDPSMGWGALAPEVEIHSVRGRHLTSITNHIDSIAMRLNDVLQRVQACP
jgi:amino acid adenylation domain-containing protein